MSDLPAVPDGWTAFLHRYGDEIVHNARKWFGDHYKEVSASETGDLHAACTAVDQEVALRAQGAVNAAHAEADALEAQAAAIRPAEPRTDTAEATPVSEPTVAPTDTGAETPAPADMPSA